MGLGRLRINTSGLTRLNRKIDRAGKAFEKKTSGAIMRDSAKPMLKAARDEVPVSHKGAEYVRLNSPNKINDYRRGGSTRKDLRIAIVAGKVGEVVRVLVGVPNRKGKVGWRTHFITKGTIKMRANDFLKRAHDSTIAEVLSNISRKALTTVTRLLR